jgi:hypothetical protein
MRPYDGAWRRIRPVILARDAYQCQIRLPVCTGRATQVDHIIEPDDGGAWHDPRNLRAPLHATGDQVAYGSNPTSCSGASGTRATGRSGSTLRLNRNGS